MWIWILILRRGVRHISVECYVFAGPSIERSIEGLFCYENETVGTLTNMGEGEGVMLPFLG